MARTRTIRRSTKRSKAKKSRLGFLPENVQAFLARRFVDIFALALTLTGLFLLTALLTYNHTDPSWNTAGSGPAQISVVTNWMGASGAWVSDLLLQTMGIGGFVFSVVFLSWGLRAFNRQSLSPLWLRAIALLFSVVSASVASSQRPSGDWIIHPYWGGSAGTLILEKFSGWGEGLVLWPGHTFIAMMAGLVALGSFLFAAAVTKAEMAWVSGKLLAFVTGSAVLAYSLVISFQNWVRYHNSPDYRPVSLGFLKSSLSESSFRIKARIQPLISARTSQLAASEDFEGDVPQESLPEKLKPALQAAPSPHIPVVKVQGSSKTQIQENQQRRFNLSDAENWQFPPLSLLQECPKEEGSPQLNESALRKNAELLKNVLADFNIQGEITSIHPGPVVTLYELEPAPGTKSARVIALSDDIARSMSAVSVRVAVVPGRNVIGIELPNKTRQIVYMQELLASRLFEKTSAKLPLILGKDIGGQPILADLAKMPHLLVAGTTGSGKSVAVNTMILSLLFCLSPEKCRFIMIDPKMLELSVYDGIPHLLSPVVTEPGKAVVSLKWTVQEMEERYRAMSKLGVRNIEGYNARLREASKKGETIMTKLQTGFDPETGKPTFEQQPMDLTELPYIVVVVDEFADLMLVAGKDVESAIQRLAQMARAAGIHLIMATQRPSVDVITGVIKANFPTRISFQVTSKIDSRTILGEGGAEQLLGMGDMLYMAPGGRITRVHGPFVSDSDVESSVAFLKAQAEPSYIDSITDGDGSFGDSELMMAMFGGGKEDQTDKVDELYDKAVALVAREGKASTSFVQRYLQIGYNRAARIVEEMERQGVISPANATGKREVLIRDFSDV